MNQIFGEIFTSLAMIWRRRWVIVIVAWVCSVVGWLVVATIPDRFESNARVYIDTDSILAPLMSGIAAEIDVFQQVDIMQRTLFSRPNLEKVVMMTDLDLTVTTPQEREALLQNLAEHITLSQQGINLFVVSFEDSDRELTKNVVQSMLSIFVEGQLGANRTDMDQTRTFLEDQVADYQVKLESAERQIADFKQANMGLLPGSGDFFSRIEQVRAQYAATQQQYNEAEASLALMRSQLAAIPQFFELQAPGSAMDFADSGAGSGPPSNLMMRIFELENQIDSLLLRYTDKHPDVVAARKLLDQLLAEQTAEDEAVAAALAERLAEEVANPLPRASFATATQPNPVYEQLQVQFINQENIIATLKQRLAGEARAVEDWERKASTVPYVEAEFNRLLRDYGLQQQKYDELRERQESARLANEVETKTDKVQFRIVDPPQVPITPIGPNRPILLSGVFIASLGIGAAIALVLGMLKGSFPTTTRLRAVVPFPVLGSVSAVMSAADRRRHVFALTSFSAITVGLITTYAGLVVVESLSGDLALEAMAIADRLHMTFVFELLKGVIKSLNLT